VSMGPSSKFAKVWVLVCMTIGILTAAGAYAQRERVIQPPADSERYGRKFFVQLRAMFGRFRDVDLQRAFEKAQPIQCSELVNEDGEWRTVAFFNEKRELGDWYRSRLEEVKTDLTVFRFTGTCRGDHGPVQLTTKFPVTESIEAYNQQRIGLDEVDVNVNAPVRASFDVQTQAYTFDLPYLFLISRQDDESLYSLAPPRLAERDKYATDVTDHWECKSVTAENVTYQFLLCRTTTLPRSAAARAQSRGPAAFGASAFFILSDGKEASSNVKLTFNDADNTAHAIEDAGAIAADRPDPPAEWESPDPDEKLLQVVRDEFRIRFNPQSWMGNVGTSQVLAAQRLQNLQTFSPAPGADYCIWVPAAPAAAARILDTKGEPVSYAVAEHDQDLRSPTSIVFQMKASSQHLGELQCFFPRLSSAASIAFGRWTAITGNHLTLEVRP
jgi:hypothetical protein